MGCLVNIIFLGSNQGNNSDFIFWYLDILNNSSPISKLIFLTYAVAGDYKAAVRWAKARKVSYSEYSGPQLFNPEYEPDISFCLCLTKDESDPHYKMIRDVVSQLGISFLFSPHL